MHACAGNRLVGIDQIFALAEGIEHHRHRANVKPMTADPQQVIEHPRNLVEHDANVLSAHRHIDAEQFFNRHAVGMLVTHHRHVVESIHVRQRLHPGLVLGKLLGSTMQQADVRIGTHDHFAVKLEHHTQHTVRGRVLRAEVQRKIAQFSHYSTSP